MQQIDPQTLNWSIADVSDGRRGWLSHKFEHLISPESLQLILGLVSAIPNSQGDKLVWGMTQNGIFSTKSAYSVITEKSSSNSNLWKVIWKNDLPQRVRCFLWLLAKGGLATNSFIFKRKIAPSDCCSRCNLSPETVIHVMRDCPKAQAIWNLLRATPSDPSFFTQQVYDWFINNLKDNSDSHFQVPWNVVFAITLWAIWQDRNDEHFKNATTDHFSLLHKIKYHCSTHSNLSSADQMSAMQGQPNILLTHVFKKLIKLLTH
ncbi:Reverse transcriptase zinc-binding domain [Sesbania bispinosa]|nr:Reverse transcriptase zinc-binding domain [Sesbania bispinosa]